jgi:hypothetical protein
VVEAAAELDEGGHGLTDARRIDAGMVSGGAESASPRSGQA